MPSCSQTHRPVRNRAKSAGGIAALSALLLLGSAPGGVAQQSGGTESGEELYDMSKAAEALLQVPVSSLHPGGSAMDPGLRSPVADDPEAARRGMQYYVGFNCDGCHAANGGGGMGPSLSNSKFIYGSSPGNIFLSIYQGRPNGMPAWGGSLPAEVIWDLVAYVRSISKDDGGSWGTTTSLETFEIEQVPAEFIQTADPWSKTQPFSFGKKPDATK